MNFPGDNKTLDIDSQFMVGDSLLVSPVVEQGASEVEAYFPTGKWFSFEGSQVIIGPSIKKLAAPLGSIPLHIRAGKIVPTQRYHLTTDRVRKSPFALRVALDADDIPNAKGTLYIDDGEAEKVDGKGSMYLAFEAESDSKGGVIKVTNESDGDMEVVIVEEVILLGMDCIGGVDNVMLKGESIDKDKVDVTAKSVKITDLDVTVVDGVLLEWVCLAVTVSS